MITLTRNRILEKGDEFRDNGAWKKVPESDIGLQIEFSRYKEVRRPNEANAASEKTSAPAHSGAGDSLPTIRSPENFPVPVLAETEPRNAHGLQAVHETNTQEARESTPELSRSKTAEPDSRGGEKQLPTIISPKAHRAGEVTKHHVETDPTTLLTGKDGDSIQIRWPDKGLIWIGRNGTFRQVALNLHNLGGEVIRMIPVGERLGAAKNAVMEFPVSEIPQVVDWLLRNQKPKGIT